MSREGRRRGAPGLRRRTRHARYFAGVPHAASSSLRRQAGGRPPPRYRPPFRVRPEESEGQPLYALGNGQWDIPALRRLLGEVLPQDTASNDFEVEHDFPAIGRRVMLLNGRRSREAGFDSHLTKPADPAALRRLLASGSETPERGREGR